MNKIKDFLEYYTTKQQIPLSFKAASSEASFKLKKIGDPDSITIKMSTDDGTTWTDLNIDTTVTLPVGTVCLLSGANTSFSKDRSNYYQFEIVDDIQVYGDLMSLCDYSRELNENYQFYALFSGCTGIKGTPDLTAYKLTDWCYASMFYGCTGLVNALDLKAPTLAPYCYNAMFNGCTSLTSAPALPATTLANWCYGMMFAGCTSLTSAPSLPALNLVSNCYTNMFAGCISLTSVPSILPATTLAFACYWGMFGGCSSLLSAPVLPATSLTNANDCYYGMFADCTSLTGAPQLPATTIAGYCYRNMFRGCSSLTNAPILPATEVDGSCYHSMFEGCTSLTSAPDLLATTLELYCYSHMFAGCSSLSTAPSLPATTLAQDCYSYMFDGCTSLTKAPSLPAAELKVCCYENMFAGCNQLTELTVGFSDWTDTSTTSATLNWVNGITNNDGWFNCPVELEEIKDESHIPINWRVNKVVPRNQNPLTFTNVGSVSTQIQLTNNGALSALSAIDLHYSINDGTWQKYTLNDYIDLQPGDSVAMSGNNSTFSQGYNKSYKFQLGNVADSRIAASGNIMSLVNFSEDINPRGFSQLFAGNNYLVSAPQLPATGVTSGCYSSMFSDCSSLVTPPPSLPALTAAQSCYSYMFANCTSLTSAPQIQAVKFGDSSCYSMFQFCQSLSTAPEIKAIEVGYECCWQMFLYCTNMTTPPSILPANTLSESCYAFMFFGCTSLTAAPELPANYLARACYNQTFGNCYNLVVPPPSIGEHVGFQGCWYMFNRCYSLTSTPALPATSLTFACYKGMFSQCSSLVVPPQLPATELYSDCYEDMFSGCTSLTDAPVMSATTLVNYCSEWMFNGCTSLTSINVNFTDWERYATSNWVKDVAPTGIFTCPSSLQLLVNDSHIPFGWRVFDYEGNERFPNFDPLIFKAVDGASQISFNKVGNPYTFKGLGYSINDGEWQEYTLGDVINLNQNDIVAFSGNNDQSSGFSKDANNYYKFAMTGYVDCSGSIGSLFGYDNALTVTIGGLNRLFEACTGLLTAPQLLLSHIGTSACMYMFHDCWSLTAIPQFTYYTSTSHYGCAHMFENCSSLVTAPPISFYQPDPPSLSDVFAYMYKNCTSLTGTVVISGYPRVNVWNQHNFDSVFENCSGITDAQIYNLGHQVEQNLFKGCKSLTSITINDTSWPSNGYNNWVSGVAPTGIFYKKSSLSTIYGNHYIPGSWAVVNIDEEKQPLTFKAVRGSTDIMMETVGEVSTAIPVLKYNKENTEWLDFIPDETVVHLEQGETAAFSGAATNNFTNNNETGGSRYRRFVTTGYYELDGNLQSLFEYSQNLRDDEPGPLFTHNSGMVKAPDVLPAKRIGKYSYYCMFNNCTSLTVAPYIACVDIGNSKGTFGGMFGDCTSLTHMNSGILNIRVAYTTCQNMFLNCTSLTAAPDLNISNVGSHTHLLSMFEGCTALSTPPKFLNCVERKLDCKRMFRNCTSLTATPPGLEDLYPNDMGGFTQMFEGCTNLVKGPDYLITKNAYMSAMFKGCSKLTKAPELRNITNESLTTTNGMKEMFNGCSSLSSITVWFTDWNNEVATQNWVSGVAQSGNFECPQLLPVKLGNNNIPKKWRINGQETDNNYGDSLTFIAKVKNSTITLNKNGSPTNAVVYYNKNYEGWTPYEFGTTITVENIGEAVAFSGSTTTFSQSDANYYQFTSNGTSRFELTGNVMSLVNFADTVNYQWQFYKLFADCSAVLNTPQLPSKALQSHCYRSMFDKCYNLTAACQFPIYTTNIKESSLRSMFFGCSSLLTVPEEIDCNTKTVETEGCKYMFDGCTAMSGSISLPASSLNTACYYQMFSGCNALTGIEVGFEDWNSKAYTSDWVNGITNNIGVFTKPSGLATLKDKDHIPINWLVEDGRIKEPLTFTAKSASNISLDKVGDDTSHLTAAIKYNKNGDGWTDYTAGDVISLDENDVVMFSGNNNNFSYSENEYYQFKMTGTIEASGNVQSLLNFNENVTNWCYRSLFDGCSGLLTVPALSATTLAYGCYRAIFANCTSLSTVPVDLLPVTTLANGCYMYMFANCTSLSTAPALIAEIAAPSCYMNMFEGCTSLINAPILPATTVANRCYVAMFQDCTALSAAPELPATTVAAFCYHGMFLGCSNLVTAPSVLPATTLATWCYADMFRNCTSLSSAPQLPATGLADACYGHMFNSCSSLTDAPYLPATTLAWRCYSHMFSGCTSLTSIEVPFTDWSQTSEATFGWVGNVAPTGVFTKPNTLNAEYGNDRIPTNWTVQIVYYPLTFTAKSASNVLLSSVGSPSAITLDYKLNDGQWTAYTMNTQIDLASGDTIAFSGANDHFSKDETNYYNFVMTGLIQADGNVQALMNYSDDTSYYCYKSLFNNCSSLVTPPQLQATTLRQGCYKGIFAGCTSLSTAPSLPATTLSTECYKYMFKQCTSLKTAPILPATRISGWGDYHGMFSGCTSLTSTPNLPASALNDHAYTEMFAGCTSLTSIPQDLLPANNMIQYCYELMFQGCTGLSSIPSGLLHATTLAQKCYKSMFAGCTNLSSIPQNLLPATTAYSECYYAMFSGCTSLSSIPTNFLPAQTLYGSCYGNMFSGCTSLTSAPQLPATNLANYCYNNMFGGCTALITAPSLPATTLAQNCYASMFAGCTSLSTAQSLSATTLAQNCYMAMFQNCSNLSNAPQLSATTLADGCYSHMFKGCTSLSTAPALPATILTDGCYYQMFNGCTSLTDAPQILATTLKPNSCKQMFSGCTSLTSISVNWTEWNQADYDTYHWVIGVAANGTFIKPEALSTEYGTSRIPTNWTVKSTNPLTFKGLNATNAICLSAIGSPVAVDLSYSKDGEEWNVYTIGDVIELSANQTVMFKGSNNYFSSDPNNYYKFVMTGSIQSYGNIQSLLNYSDNAPAYCYKSLFNGCSSLLTAPQLPATTLNDYCYHVMFQNCTSLTSVLSLPATTLANSCYQYMFGGCTSLSTVPQNLLPVTTLANSCYAYMFFQCTSLTDAPALPASTLANYCYQYMFRGCSRLSSTPALPATTLADYCYNGMFQHCSRLSSVPQLSATTLASHCYAGMFAECTSLSTAPYLPASTMAYRCYQGIFNGCTNLTTISTAITDWGTSYDTLNWVSGVAPTGTFWKLSTLSAEYGDSRIPTNWNVMHIDVDYTPLTFTAKSSTANIKLSGILGIDLQYSINGNNWTNYSINTQIDLNQNDTVAFSGNNDHFSEDFEDYYRFQMTGTIEASGNIQSLMNFSNSVKSYCYYHLFESCTSLTDAPELPATTLAERCYIGMFYGCSNLSSAPQLPASTLYRSCYQQMFQGCSNLSSAPQLPASTLADDCYWDMFHGCTKLTDAPQLPATILCGGCYYSMFYGCSNLSSAPSLPVTTLAPYCYYQMFYNCTNLSSAPQLPATTLCANCYREMFRGCSNLSSINVSFTDWTQATDATTNWVSGVAANGEFTKPNELAEEYGTSRIPVGWTIPGEEVDPLTVPLTILAKSAGSISFTKVSNPNAATVSYSKNGGEWTTYTWNDTISLVSGDTVAFSGANTKMGKDKNNYYHFVTPANTVIEAYGNVQSLLNWSSGCTEYCYQSLFDSCSGIVDASGVLLPVVTLASHCYRAMFAKCPNLSSAPIIWATTAAPSCCWYMYQDCKKLLDAPEIKCTTLANNCFGYMYTGCSNLSSINVNFTDWGSGSYTGGWVGSVKNNSSCKFYKPAALPNTKNGSNYIPTNWTIVEK